MNDEYDFEGFAPWLVIFTTLIGVGLRVYLLDNKGMWLDESFSVWLASHGVGDMLRWIVQIDQHPPLYYLLLHSWINRYGDTSYSVRLLSVLFGAATIPMIYLIGKRISGVAVGLVAAALLAFSPFNIRYAQETRMYTLLTFNVAVAIYALVRLLTDSRSNRPIGAQFREYWKSWRTGKPEKPTTSEEFSYIDDAHQTTGLRAWIARLRWSTIKIIETDLAWVALIVFSAATLLTHNTAVLFLVAINIFVLGLSVFQRSMRSEAPLAFQSPSLGNWLKAQLGIFILWSPWLIAFIQQASRVYQEFWVPKPDWTTVLQTLRAFLNEQTPGFASQIWIMWILYAVVLGLGLVYFRRKISQLLFLAALFAIPILGELIVSIWRPIFLERTLLWVTLPVLLVLAAGIAQFRYRFLILLVVGILITNNFSSTADYYRFARKEDWFNPAGYVANFAEEGDLILFNAGWVQIPFDYYFRTYEDLYAIRVEKHGVPEDMFASGILEPKMTENDIPGLISLLNGRERVWLVYSHNAYTDPKGFIPQTIETKMKLIRKREYYGVQLFLYEAP